jgi:STE24 endopeptidase
MMDFATTLIAKTGLPWTPRYSQSVYDRTEEISGLEYWALALTITFIVFVYASEGMLDGRQKKAYEKTTFPQELETTVSKIDAEAEHKPILPQLKAKFDSSQTYGLDKIHFGMISSTYDTFETVAFLLLGFLPYMWDKAAIVGEEYFGWSERENEIKITLIFLAFVTLVGTATTLPFEIVRTLCWVTTLSNNRSHSVCHSHLLYATVFNVYDRKEARIQQTDPRLVLYRQAQVVRIDLSNR